MVPLPTEAEDREPFSVEFELEVPAHLFIPHDNWRCLQTMTRLQSPSERGVVPSASQRVSIDGLREIALTISHRVKTDREAFTRECLLANSLLARTPTPRQLSRIPTLYRAIEDEILDVRSSLAPAPEDGPEIVQERALVVEFVSNQLLELLFHVRRETDNSLRRPDGAHTDALRATAEELDQSVNRSFERELAYREARGFLSPTCDDPEVLEHYLERVSALKKHFHELLFLSAETRSVDAKVRNWGALVGTTMASVFGFALNKTGVLGHWTASLGIVLAAVIGAAAYTMQDRIKEYGKTHLASRIGKHYAQRVTRLFVPPRGKATEGKLVSTIEDSITAKLQHRPDPLNPDAGATRGVHVVRYRSRGVAQVLPELRERGIVSLKQIFRYDLSWLFTRLDDARKSIPVLDARGLRVAKAPRLYRMPVRVELTIGDRNYRSSGTAILHKGGVERFELAPESHEASVQPALGAAVRVS